MRANWFDQIRFRLAEMERRLNNIQRPGKVVEIDAAKGVVKVQFTQADGKPITSPWIPWTTRAGKIKIWHPPSVGEQVIIHSPSGEMGLHSWVAPGGFSKDNPQNHDKDGEYKMTVEDGDGNVKYQYAIDEDGNTTNAQKSLTMVANRIDHNYGNASGSGGGPSGVNIA